MKRIASIIAVAIVAVAAMAVPALGHDAFYYPYRWDDPWMYDDNPAPFRKPGLAPYVIYVAPWEGARVYYVAPERIERRSFYYRDRRYHYYIDVARVRRR